MSSYTKEMTSYTKDPTFGENSPLTSHTNVRARAIGAIRGADFTPPDGAKYK